MSSIKHFNTLKENCLATEETIARDKKELDKFIVSRLNKHRDTIAIVLTKKNGGYFKIVPSDLKWTVSQGEIRIEQIENEVIAFTIASNQQNSKPQIYIVPEWLIFACVHTVARYARGKFYATRDELQRARIKDLQKEIGRIEIQIGKSAELLEEKMKLHKTLYK